MQVQKEPEMLTHRAASNGISITETVGGFFPHRSQRPDEVKSEQSIRKYLLRNWRNHEASEENGFMVLGMQLTMEENKKKIWKQWQTKAELSFIPCFSLP